MYIKRASIQNIRSLSDLTWQIEPEQASGWHVILGDNGAGKTAFVRAIVLALVGQERAYALRQDWNGWLRYGEEKGQVKLNLVRNDDWDQVQQISPEEEPFPDKPTPQHERLVRKMEDEVYEHPSVTVTFRRKDNRVLNGWKQAPGKYNPYNFVWGMGAGWFSASYGPFRRFSGSDDSYNDIMRKDSVLARHLTAFGEDVASTETLAWIKNLRFLQLEGEPEGHLLERVFTFINQENFLPGGVCLKSVSSKSVDFADANGSIIPIQELSDGFRSVLCMTLELLRQLAICYGWDTFFAPDDPTCIIAPGVVLIDEVDAHLHPTWQRRIGPWFRRRFPNMQFIVTTHSPLVCQAATHGTVFRLPTPGTKEQGGMITGVELDRLLYGNILDAYSTGAFGGGITRSEESRLRTRRLAELNRKELHGALTADEEAEQTRLRAMLPTTAHMLNEEATV